MLLNVISTLNVSNSLAICNVSKSSQDVILSCESSALQRINMEKIEVVQKTTQGDCNYTMLRCGQFLCCGTNTGSIDILSLDTFEKRWTFKAPAGHISDFDIQGGNLLTCGYSLRNHVCIREPLIKLYDLRNNGKMTPLTFPSGPLCLRFHPRSPSFIFVASSTGNLSMINIQNSALSSHFQVPLRGYLVRFEISSTGDELIFTDSEGDIQLWSINDVDSLLKAAKTSHLDRPNNDHLTMILPENINHFNELGLPFYNEPLLSLLPSQYKFAINKLPVKIHASLLTAAKKYSGISIAPNLLKLKALCITGDRLYGQAEEYQNYRFRSELIRSGLAQSFYEDEIKDEANNGHVIARLYKPFSVKHSKFGIEDFDFTYFNKSPYAGLEPTEARLPFLNSLLQILYSLKIFCEILTNHCVSSCSLKICLACELGFLFQMLKDSENGQSCHTSNLNAAIKNFSKLNCSNLELSKLTEPQCLLNFLSQLLAQLKEEIPEFPLEELLGATIEHNSRCSCGYKKYEDTLCYFPILKLHSNTIGSTLDRFGLAVQNSIQNSQVLPIEHNFKNDYESHMSSLSVHKKSFGKFLFLNASSIYSDEKWIEKIAPSIYIFVREENGKKIVTALNEPLLNAFRNSYIYRLKAALYKISDHEKINHYVSVIRPDLSNGNEDHWYLFNDFMIKKVPMEEVTKCPEIWKTPILFLYEEMSIEIQWAPKPMDLSILFNSTSNNEHIKALDPEIEQPNPELKVAIDTEFVALEPEQIESHSDKTKMIIRPARLLLARISVLRVNRSGVPEPFIDDYVETNETVYDYLSEYSGIHDGDLDPKRSTHNLVSPKFAYKKLRLLVSLGCQFIGHGLSKDFRIINIIVPSKQIIDTVEIYYLQAWQRKLSLRYLAWYLFNEDIQKTEHDSIEDAYTAVRLYYHYLDLTERNEMPQTLLNLYRDGKALNYKPIENP